MRNVMTAYLFPIALLAGLAVSGTALAGGQIDITGSIPRGSFAALDFTVKVSGIDDTLFNANPDTTDTTQLASRVNVYITQIDTAQPLSWNQAVISNGDAVYVREAASHESGIDPGSSPPTHYYIFHLEVQETQSGFLSQKINNGTASVGVKFVLGSTTVADTSTTQKALTVSNYVIAGAPALTSIVGTEQTLFLAWAPPGTVQTLPPNQAAPTGVDIYVVDLSVVTTPVALSCMQFKGSTTAVSTGGTAPADVPATAPGCVFTPPTTTTGACLKTTDVDPGTKLSLDYLVPSAISAANINGVKVIPNVPIGTTSYSVPGLTDGTPYAVFLQYEPTGTVVSSCTTATPSPNYSITELNGEGGAQVVDFRCFIATAAYGSPLHPDLHFFRKFRERVLLPNPVGKAFVHYYYKYSPPAADFIARHETLRGATRAALALPLSLLKEFDEYY